MEDVKLKLNEKGQGAFFVMDGAEQMGEMVVGMSGKNMTVYHTEVARKAEGKGLAKKILTAMVEYARKNGLNVIPICPFVSAHFMRNREEYADVWNHDNPKEERDR